MLKILWLGEKWMLSVTFPVGWRNGNMFSRNLWWSLYSLRQRRQTLTRFDHSSTVTPAVRHGKTECFTVFERSNDSRDPYNNWGRQANVPFPTIEVSFLWRMISWSSSWQGEKDCVTYTLSSPDHSGREDVSAEPRKWLSDISFKENVFSCDAISKERISDTDYLAKQESNQAPTAETEHSMFPLTCVNLSPIFSLGSAGFC